MKRIPPFSEIISGGQLGRMHGPVAFDVSADVNEQCLFAQRDYNDLYLHGRGDGSPMLHPGALLHHSTTDTLPRTLLADGWTSRLGEEEIRWLAPAFVDEPLTITSTFTEYGERRGRPWFVREMVIRNDAGQLKVVRRAHSACVEQKGG